MPPLYPPIAIMMVLEALAMNLWLFWAYRKKGWNIYFVLIIAFIIQRGVRVIFILAAQKFLDLPGSWLLIPVLLWGLPGVVIQTVLIPWILPRIKEQSGTAGTLGTIELSDKSDRSDTSDIAESPGAVKTPGTI
jgi:hypothetical protein